MKDIKEILEENKNIEKQLKTSEKCLTDTPPGPSKYACKYNEQYTPLLLQLLYQLGRNDKEVCEKIGISQTTLYSWKKKFPEVKKAIKEGKDSINRQIENSLIKRAIGFFKTTETETIKDENGNIKAVKVKERTILPDCNSAMWLLAHRKPQQYGNNQENEFDSEFLELQFKSIFSKRNKVLKFDDRDYQEEK